MEIHRSAGWLLQPGNAGLTVWVYTCEEHGIKSVSTTGVRVGEG